MSFIADKQTLDDLNLLGKYKPNSIFSVFNRVHTAGGEKLLFSMFSDPLSDPEEINRRSDTFRYFQSKSFTFPFIHHQFEIMENYLDENVENSILLAGVGNLKKLVLGSLVTDQQYTILQTGIQATINILDTCYEFISTLKEQNVTNPYSEQLKFVQSFFNDKRLGWFDKEKSVKKLSFFKLTQYDRLLRRTLQKELATLIEIIYYLDVYIAVGNIAKERKFTYAIALPKENNLIIAEELSHPFLEKAKGNSIALYQESNILFLTGANMAGKSTLMKTFGIALYLAHMGFPIAAKNMQFSIMDGIYSSINVSDNLNMGYSHFYAEVLRVKKAAEEVSSGKAMVVIFDELFKGTNVKDAYDATLAVTEAFSVYKNCFFIISTHIIEVGETLRHRSDGIQFYYLPTTMDGVIPRYTYKLESGITTDRQGMTIIENEGILEILRNEIIIRNK